MALRKVVLIDEDLCDGCGECVPSCAEGAIQIINGKARLAGDNLCDGMGACLGDCPLGAITIEEREADEFDERAVEEHLFKLNEIERKPQPIALSSSCPGSMARQFGAASKSVSEVIPTALPSQLNHWPVQLMLVPPHAPFLKGADLLICADCVPFTVPDFHTRYLSNRAVLVGCPKLDDLKFYLDKLKDIFKEAKPSHITVLKMEVPCCNGIAQVATMAHKEICSEIPIEVHTIGIKGVILEKSFS